MSLLYKASLLHVKSKSLGLFRPISLFGTRKIRLLFCCCLFYGKNVTFGSSARPIYVHLSICWQTDWLYRSVVDVTNWRWSWTLHKTDLWGFIASTKHVSGFAHEMKWACFHLEWYKLLDLKHLLNNTSANPFITSSLWIIYFSVVSTG